jgi:transcription antitermination protein NusB
MSDASPSAQPPDSRRPAAAPRAPRPNRRLSREFAVQGLYEWQLTAHDLGVIDANLRESEDFAQCDAAFFDALLHGCAAERSALDEHLARHGDRTPAELSPVEHAVLWIGVWELLRAPDVPYRVVINEGVELAKAFGGTDGHRYVNGVLDQAAKALRAPELAAAGKSPRRPSPGRPDRGPQRGPSR